MIVATDAPLIATQLDRIAQRAVMGIARVGGVGEHSSGDFVVSFSTANTSLPAENLDPQPPYSASEYTPNDYWDFSTAGQRALVLRQAVGRPVKSPALHD